MRALALQSSGRDPSPAPEQERKLSQTLGKISFRSRKETLLLRKLIFPGVLFSRGVFFVKDLRYDSARGQRKCKADARTKLLGRATL